MNKTERFDRIYDLLVSIGGACNCERGSFIYHHAETEHGCDEWRFQGKLGFGGKYRSKSNTVDCYMEDSTPERLEIIQNLNTELTKHQ